MKTASILVTLLLTGIILIGGCSQPSLPAQPETGMDSAMPLATAVPITTPEASSDPFVGTWVCKSYLTSGPLKKEYTILDNGTWTRTNTNLNSLVQSYSHGTWRKEGDDAYVIKGVQGGSAIFEYDRLKDELYEPGFKETFRRIPPDILLDRQIKTMNLTIYSAAKVSKIDGERLNSGKVFFLVNMSIENVNDPGGFSLNDRNIRVIYGDDKESFAMNQGLEEEIDNALFSDVIAPGETRQGTVIFAIPESTGSCRLIIVNNDGDVVSNTVELRDIPTA